MRIVHGSDFHWQFGKLPEADLYVFTGDLYDNYLRLSKPTKKQAKKMDYLGQDGHGGSYIIDKAYEAQMQRKAALLFAKSGGFRQYLGSPDAPIVAVRGNHDFTDVAPIFLGCNFVHEFVNNEVVEVAGLRITGHRGVPWINGNWNDEMTHADLTDRVRDFDMSCDLYLTHYPPAGIGLDLPGHWGLSAMVNWFGYNHVGKPLLCHGHIHECGGLVKQVLNATYSNAATTYNVIEGSPEEGWKDVSPI